MTRLTSGPLLFALALTACDAAAPVDDTSASETDSPEDTGSPVDTGPDDTGTIAWSPDPTQCFETQLAAEDPERIDVPASGFVMSCRPRWIHEQHCYGVPDAPNDLFELEWKPWANRYGYHSDGTRPEDGFDMLDVEVPPKAVLGPNNTCIALNDHYWSYDVHNHATWSASQGNCTIEVVQQCLCNNVGEPDDPACLDIVVP